MTALESAARAGDWDRVVLYLLRGLLSVIEALPPESLSELIELLMEDTDPGGVDGS
jgi:hypothetical protein